MGCVSVSREAIHTLTLIILVTDSVFTWQIHAAVAFLQVWKMKKSQ